MTDRLGSACWVLLCVLLAVGHGAERKTPTLTWTGRWEKTNLHQSYHSFVKLADGRIASFVNEGLPGSDCNCPGVEFPGGVVVSFTREPGNLLTWTTSAPLMTWGMIDDLPDLADPKKAAPKRLMTRPTVARLSDGEFWGLGAISRDHPAVDGLWYIASFVGSAERVNMLKAALLAGRSAPRSAMWKYRGKVTGPLGDYQDKLQVPNAMSTGVGSLIHLPDGPPAPDHVRVTRNRFLLFADAVGSPDLKNNGWVWTSLCYSADGREWFFAKDAAGAVRNVTPYRDAKKEDYMFPFVLRRAADEWWMWRSAGFQGKEDEDKSWGSHEVFLYYSSDGLNWRFVRTDVTSRDVLGSDGTPLGLKNMSIYYDPETQEIHGMLSARNEEQDPTASFWRKYHNVAKVSVK